MPVVPPRPVIPPAVPAIPPWTPPPPVSPRPLPVPPPTLPTPAPLPSYPVPVLVPRVVGLDLGTARQVLMSVGLTVGSVSAEESDASPGTVLATSPRAGSFLPRGTAVKLVVAG